VGTVVLLDQTGLNSDVTRAVLLAAIVFLLFDCIRHARSLGGAALGALTAVALSLPFVADDLLFHRSYDGSWNTVLSFVAFVTAGAAFGFIVAGAAWLLRRLFRLRERPEPVPLPRLHGGPLAVVVLLAVLPLTESFAWAYLSVFSTIIGYHNDSTAAIRGWGPFCLLDRAVIVGLASLAAYSMHRRWRWARGATALYLMTGLAIALVRASFYRMLTHTYPMPVFGTLPTPDCGYQLTNVVMTPIPRIPFELIVRANAVEAWLRALACCILVPYLFFSRGAKVAFGRNSQPELPAARTELGP
jgi:hypothetical protein